MNFRHFQNHQQSECHHRKTEESSKFEISKQTSSPKNWILKEGLKSIYLPWLSTLLLVGGSRPTRAVSCKNWM